MASNTPFLNLFKRDPLTEPTALFNIKEMMNDNWDKIDAVFNANPDADGTPQNPFTPLCKIGTYIGSGGHGSSNPCVISDIGFIPDVVFGFDVPSTTNYECIKLIRPFSGGVWPVILGDDSVSWCFESSGSGADGIQCNTAGNVYYYLILGHKEANLS